MAFPPIYILRHGETEWNRAGIIQGWHDSVLTERGREQAARQNGLLKAAGVDGAGHLALCSPLGRARQTAAIALDGIVAPAFDDDLREITLGVWEGRTRDEIHARWPGPEGENLLDWYDRAEGGEGLAGLRARVERVLDRIRQGGKPAVIVTHGVVSRFVRARLLDAEPASLSAPDAGQGQVAYLADGALRWL